MVNLILYVLPVSSKLFGNFCRSTHTGVAMEKKTKRKRDSTEAICDVFF